MCILAYFCLFTCLFFHYIFHFFVLFQRPKSHQWNTVYVVTLALMPVSYFFTNLYYTDQGSTFFVLLMYLLCLRHQHFLSAMFGIVAILFRQTNAIWVLYCFSLTAIDVIETRLRLDKKLLNINRLSDWEIFKSLLKHAFSSLTNFLSLLVAILKVTFWYIFVICCFVIFIVLNKGIVVGDKKHHSASLNFPQVFYFLLMSGAFTFPHIARPTQILQFIKSTTQHPIRTILFILASCILIQYFTYEHKYLLSDNRHYTFYIWSKIFRWHQFVKFIFIPIYLYGLYQFYQSTIAKGCLWRVATCLCIVLSLVPQALLEFRYFIIPFYILRLNMKKSCKLALAIEMVLVISVNLFTFYMFSEKHFYWPNDPNPQRFMW